MQVYCRVVAMLLQWCCSGVAVVLQWCCSGVEVLLQRGQRAQGCAREAAGVL